MSGRKQLLRRDAPLRHNVAGVELQVHFLASAEDEGLLVMGKLGAESAEAPRQGSSPLDGHEVLARTLVLLHNVKPNATPRPLSIRPSPEYAVVKGVLRPKGPFCIWLRGYLATYGSPCEIQWCDSYPLSVQFNKGRRETMGALSFVHIELAASPNSC